jgi:hypothetical protein
LDAAHFQDRIAHSHSHLPNSNSQYETQAAPPLPGPGPRKGEAGPASGGFDAPACVIRRTAQKTPSTLCCFPQPDREKAAFSANRFAFLDRNGLLAFNYKQFSHKNQALFQKFLY